MKPKTEKLVAAWLGPKWRMRLVVLVLIVIIGIAIIEGIR